MGAFASIYFEKSLIAPIDFDEISILIHIVHRYFNNFDRRDENDILETWWQRVKNPNFVDLDLTDFLDPPFLQTYLIIGYHI